MSSNARLGRLGGTDRSDQRPWRRAAVVSVLVSLSALSPACRNADAASHGEPPTPVRVRAVSEPTDPRGARYSGTIEPATRVDAAFKVSGYVRNLLQVKGTNGKLRKVQEGDFVAAGTVMAIVREGDYVEKVAVANAQLAQAVANANQAQIDSDRSRKLVASNAVPAAELDTTSSRLAAANALVSGAEAQARDARLLLGDTSLRAPISGIVLKRTVEVGALVTPGTPAFSLADTSHVKFVFGAPDSLLGQMREGSKLTVHVDALNSDVDGTITRTAASADSKSHVFEIEATISNADGRLKPGFVASLGVSAPRREGPVIALPLTGVVRSPADPRGFAVFVVAEDGGNAVAHRRDVTLGAVIGNEVEVVRGLQKGDRIVSMGATLLADGAHVRVLPSGGRHEP